MSSLSLPSNLTNNTILQLVTFTLCDEEYAVDILKVQEINRIKEITRLPDSQDYIEGIINLRGKIIPIVNLRKKFGLTEREDVTQLKIIIMNIQDTTIGLIVDSVSEVLRISSDIIEPPPIVSNTNMEFIKGIAKFENRLVILLDIDNLFRKNKFKQ